MPVAGTVDSGTAAGVRDPEVNEPAELAAVADRGELPVAGAGVGTGGGGPLYRLAKPRSAILIMKAGGGTG
jgi:hypothetical protein